MKSKNSLQRLLAASAEASTLLTSQSMEWWTPMSSFTTAETAPLLT